MPRSDGVKLQPIAFGSDPSFTPGIVTFGAIKKEESTIEVRFSTKNPNLGFVSVSDYIADITFNDQGEMRLAMLDYVDRYPENGKERLPSL